MSLRILKNTIKRGKYFLTGTLLYTVPSKEKLINKYYYDEDKDYSSSAIIEDNNGFVNILIDPNVNGFEKELKKNKYIRDNEGLRKFKTINIINYKIGNDKIYDKKFLIDYAFIIWSDKTSNYFKTFTNKSFTKFLDNIKIKDEKFKAANILSEEIKGSFNPFHIWNNRTEILNQNFKLLSKDLFNLEKDAIIDPSVTNNNYALKINDMIIANRLDSLDINNKFIPSIQQTIISTKDKVIPELLTIKEDSIIKRNNYFICLELQINISDDLNGRKENRSSWSNIFKNKNDEKYNILIDPNVEYFQSLLKNNKKINENETLCKFNTINIIKINETPFGKTYLIDYVFFIINNISKKYFTKYDENYFMKIDPIIIQENDYYTLNSSKIKDKNIDFFNPFYIWSKDFNTPQNFILLSKKLFNIQKDDIIDPKFANYSLLINDTIFYNIVNILDENNKLKSSSPQQKIIKDKKIVQTWIWIVVVAVILFIIIVIIISVVVKRKRLERNIMLRLQEKKYQN